MADFTSALYLGLRHEPAALTPWRSLAEGVPAALREPARALELARSLAALVGSETALLAPSTLHLFWDLPALAGERGAVLIEAGTYAVGRWGAERCGARGMPVRQFARADTAGLERELARCRRLRPLVLVDGLSPGSDRRPPLAAYAELAARHGGRLVIDDTQALGVLGQAPSRSHPYGRGGGGSLRFHGLRPAHTLVIASLAKGFGVPMAVLGGPAGELERFAAGSHTRVHCSPPSAAAIAGAEHALSVNRACGERLRARLLALVRAFRSGLARVGVRCFGGLFPVQALAPESTERVVLLQTELARRRVHTIAQRHAGERARICFVLNARHTPAEIEHAVRALADARELRAHTRALAA